MEEKNLAFEESSKKVNFRLSEQSKIFRKKVYQTGSQVYTAVGYAIETPVMVEGEDGIIIIDPCESHNAMVTIMEEFRKISDKKVTCIIYTHHHPDHWAGVEACVSQEEIDKGECQIIAHQDFEYQVARMTGILADIKIGRSLYMYGYMLPYGEEGRVNLGLGPMMQKDTQGYIAPTKTFEKELKITVSGVNMELYHIPSECVDEIGIWFPDFKVLHVAECIQGENYPNLYSIRGSNRDPLAWIRSIDLLRTFPSEYLVGNHMRPVEGKKECAKHLLDYRDMIQYTHDQTVRMMNKGYTPDNIIAKLEKLPPHLYQRPRMGEHYGTFIQAVKLVYSHNMGWFTGDAVELNPLTPSESSKKYIQLIGRKAILEEIKRALKEREYQWAAEISTQLIQANREDHDARHMKAEALRELAYQTENGPFRNWYLTQALNLDGAFEEIKKKIPEFNGPEVYYEAISKVPPQYLWDCLKVKLNGPKTENVRTGLTVIFNDCQLANDLEIRQGILEVHKAYTCQTIGQISLTKEDYVLIFTKMKSVQQLFDENKIDTTLDIKAVATFFDYFDGFTPLFDMEFPFE